MSTDRGATDDSDEWRLPLALRLVGLLLAAFGVGFWVAFVVATVAGGPDAPNLLWGLVVVPISAPFLSAALLWRSRLTARAGGLDIQNMYRRYQVPWADVLDVRGSRPGIVIDTPHGHVMASAAQGVIGTRVLGHPTRSEIIAEELLTLRERLGWAHLRSRTVDKTAISDHPRTPGM